MALQHIIDIHAESAKVLEWAEDNVPESLDDFISDVVDERGLDVDGIEDIASSIKQLTNGITVGLDFDDEMVLDAYDTCQYIVNIVSNMAVNADLIVTAFDSLDRQLTDDENLEAAIELSANLAQRLWDALYGSGFPASGNNNFNELYDALDEMVAIIQKHY